MNQQLNEKNKMIKYLEENSKNLADENIKIKTELNQMTEILILKDKAYNNIQQENRNKGRSLYWKNK